MIFNRKKPVINPDRDEDGWLRGDAVLMQIYGELNRIRIILGEGSETGERIAKFDRENNGYDPFFDSEVNFKKFNALKRKK